MALYCGPRATSCIGWCPVRFHRQDFQQCPNLKGGPHFLAFSYGWCPARWYCRDFQLCHSINLNGGPHFLAFWLMSCRMLMSLSGLSVWSQDEGLHFLVMENVIHCRKQTYRMSTPRKVLPHSRWTCLIRTGECSSVCDWSQIGTDSESHNLIWVDLEMYRSCVVLLYNIYCWRI